MAEDLRLQTVITPEGYAAALNNVPNAQGFRIELNRARPVVNSTPKDYFDVKGRRVGDYQINVTAKITSTTEEYQFNEIWIYDGISNVVFAKIKREDGGIIDYVSPTKDAYISYSFVFDTVGPGTITIVDDTEGIGLVLAELDAHKNDPDPHEHVYNKTDSDNNFVQKFGVIPNGTDLNTLQKTGIHYIPGSTAAKSLINCPIALAGYVEVVQIQKAIARQRVTTYTGVSYTRYGHSGSAASVNDADWQAWVQDGAEMVGVPLPWPSANVPEGYVALTGQAIDSVRYPKLASIYGTNMPDLRGVVIRGWDNGRGLDPDRTILSYQEDAMQRILGKFYVRSSTGGRSNVFTPADSPFSAVRNSESLSDPITVTGTATSDTTVLLDTAIGTRTADEIRMKNFSFNIICIAG